MEDEILDVPATLAAFSYEPLPERFSIVSDQPKAVLPEAVVADPGPGFVSVSFDHGRLVFGHAERKVDGSTRAWHRWETAFVHLCQDDPADVPRVGVSVDESGVFTVDAFASGGVWEWARCRLCLPAMYASVATVLATYPHPAGILGRDLGIGAWYETSIVPRDGAAEARFVAHLRLFPRAAQATCQIGLCVLEANGVVLAGTLRRPTAAFLPTVDPPLQKYTSRLCVVRTVMAMELTDSVHRTFYPLARFAVFVCRRLLVELATAIVMRLIPDSENRMDHSVFGLVSARLLSAEPMQDMATPPDLGGLHWPSSVSGQFEPISREVQHSLLGATKWIQGLASFSRPPTPADEEGRVHPHEFWFHSDSSPSAAQKPTTFGIKCFLCGVVVKEATERTDALAHPLRALWKRVLSDGLTAPDRFTETPGTRFWDDARALVLKQVDLFVTHALSASTCLRMHNRGRTQLSTPYAATRDAEKGARRALPGLPMFLFEEDIESYSCSAP
jgi:hypothetical protein